jgi:hypothetical protein
MAKLTIHWQGELKRTKGQTIIYKTLHRKLKIEQHDSHLTNVVITIRSVPHSRLNMMFIMRVT